MTCAWQDRLRLYADGELAGPELAQFEEHLRACQTCPAQALVLLQAKRAMRSAAAQVFAPTAEFRLKIAHGIRPKRSRWRLSWAPVAFATALALAILVAAAVWIRRPQPTALLAEIVDVHTATLASSNPVDVISTDRHTVKPWFEGKLPFSFNLPELQTSQFQLLGGKLVYLEQDPGAYLLFAAGKHRVSVFIFRDQVADISARSFHGFAVETWRAKGLRYLAISDATPQAVGALCDLLKSAQTENAEP